MNFLTTVKKGMPVIDSAGERLGNVSFVHFGEVTPLEAEHGQGAASISPATRQGDLNHNVVTDALSFFADFTDDDMPKEVRERLLYNGFFHVDGNGMHDHFVTPDQIHAVQHGEVLLNVPHSQLMHES